MNRKGLIVVEYVIVVIIIVLIAFIAISKASGVAATTASEPAATYHAQGKWVGVSVPGNGIQQLADTFNKLTSEEVSTARIDNFNNVIYFTHTY